VWVSNRDTIVVSCNDIESTLSSKNIRCWQSWMQSATRYGTPGSEVELASPPRWKLANTPQVRNYEKKDNCAMKNTTVALRHNCRIWTGLCMYFICVCVDFNMFVGNLDSSRTMWLSRYIAAIVLDRGPVVKRPI